MSTRALALLFAIVVLTTALPARHHKASHHGVKAHKTHHKNLEETPDAKKIADTKHNIHSMAKAIKASDVSAHAKTVELNLLKDMEQDAITMSKAKSTKSSKFEHAQNDLASKMKEVQTLTQHQKEGMELEEQIKGIDQKFKSEHLKESKQLKENLKAAIKDIHSFEESSDKAGEMRQAIDLRVKAMGMGFEEAHTESKLPAVKKNLKNMMKEIKDSDLEEDTKATIMENIKAMVKDTKTMEASDDTNQLENASAALSERMQALTMQLEEAQEPAALEEGSEESEASGEEEKEEKEEPEKKDDEESEAALEEEGSDAQELEEQSE